MSHSLHKQLPTLLDMLEWKLEQLNVSGIEDSPKLFFQGKYFVLREVTCSLKNKIHLLSY